MSIAAGIFIVFIVFAVLELPVIIAYMRGLRGHKLNVILMLVGVNFISSGFLFCWIPPFLIIWIAAFVMSFAYKPVTAGRVKNGTVEQTRRVL